MAGKKRTVEVRWPGKVSHDKVVEAVVIYVKADGGAGLKSLKMRIVRRAKWHVGKQTGEFRAVYVNQCSVMFQM